MASRVRGKAVKTDNTTIDYILDTLFDLSKALSELHEDFDNYKHNMTKRDRLAGGGFETLMTRVERLENRERLATGGFETLMYRVELLERARDGFHYSSESELES